MPHLQATHLDDLAIAYWKNLLEDVTPSHIPSLLDTVPTAQYDFQEASVDIDLNGSAIEGLCIQARITIYSILQTAWAIVVGSYTGAEDVSFGYFTSHGTSSRDANIKDLIMFRTKLAPNCTLFHVMVDMVTQMEKALQYRMCSFEQIQRFPEFEGQSLFNSVLQIEQGSKSAEDCSFTIGQGMRYDKSVGVRVPSTKLLNLTSVATRILMLTRPHSMMFERGFGWRTIAISLYSFVRERPNFLPNRLSILRIP